MGGGPFSGTAGNKKKFFITPALFPLPFNKQPYRYTPLPLL
jgi:hypothetical protein